MTTKTRTETEAIADILAALHLRVQRAEWDYTNARKLSSTECAYLSEARAGRDEARAAYRTVKAIAETVD